MSDDLGIKDVEGGESQESSGSRARSTIRFPYSDLAEAEKVARTTKNRFGQSASIDQIAGALDQKVSSGAFRVKLTSAQMFGLLTMAKGNVTLTDLGKRIADPHTQGEARVQAFLLVPLYDRLYERYQGQSLPEESGLEAEIRTLGVVENQSERARQVFLRSADQAGFFWAGRDRLILPSSVPKPDDSRHDGRKEAEAGSAPTHKPNKALDPLLARLFERMLPEDGKPFPARERKLFFSALEVNLDVVYGAVDDLSDRTGPESASL